MTVALGSTLAGHRLQAEIGRGAMGVVYLAHHLALDRRSAVKVIATELADREDFRARFVRESQVVARIDHPNVIPVTDAGEQDGTLYIAMPLVDGMDLGSLIRVYGRLPAAIAGRIVMQVAGALQVAHGAGLVHRDVKPANILVGARDGRHHAYLTDFGLAKRAAGDSGAATATDVVVGTIDYMAPEQIQAGAPVDGRADVYALGCVLFHALTGDVPFPHPSTAQKLWAHLNDAPPSPLEADESIPPAFSAIVRRAMEKDPGRRFASAEDMRRALQAALGGRAVPGLEAERPAVADAPRSAPAPARALTLEELVARFRGRTGLSLHDYGSGPTWRSFTARMEYDARGLLTEESRRVVSRYGHFALHLLEEPGDFAELLAARGADPEPDADGNHWGRDDEDPRLRGAWIVFRAHGTLACSALLPEQDPDDPTWWEVNHLTERLVSQ